MKILHLLTTNQFSGAENVCLSIMNILKNEHDVYYASVDGPIRNTVENMGHTFVPMSSFSIGNVKNVIHQIQPDVIHAHDIRASVYSAFVYRGKIISQIHGKFPEMGHISLKSVLYRLACNKINKIIYVSQSIYDDFLFKKQLDKKGFLLHNCVDYSSIQNRLRNISDAPSFDFTFIGRLEPVKNPLRFIHIIEKLSRLYKKEVSACIVGDGSLYSECESLIHSSNVNIKLVGFQKEPLRYLIHSKALIITSVTEGIPMVALEAFASEKPVISTPTDGLLEIIHEGHNGFICETDDDFVYHMMDLLSNDERYAEIVQNLKQGKDDYTSYCESIRNIYLNM